MTLTPGPSPSGREEEKQQEKPLSLKQRAFAEHYLRLWNGTQAAIAAEYSERTAAQQASRLLKNVKVQAYIEERLEELKLGADEVLVRLGEHARGSVADFIRIAEEGGDIFIDFRKAQEAGKLHLLKKVKKTVKDGEVTIEFELYDAQAALVHLGRHHRLFVERHEHTGADGEPLTDAREQLASALDRLAARLGAAGDRGEPDGG